MISGHQHQPLGGQAAGRSQARPSAFFLCITPCHPEGRRGWAKWGVKTVKHQSSAPLGKLEGMGDSFLTQKGH